MSSIVRRVGFNSPAQRIAAQRAETDHPHLWRLARPKRQSLVVDHDRRAISTHDRSLLGEVERDDRDLLAHNVFPHVELSPV